MDLQERFRRAALESGLPDEEAGRFAEHLRVVIQLSGGSGEAPVGQFGGRPRLAAHESPLPFVFSVDCAALPRIDGLGLPAGGSLLFFLDHEQDHLGAADRARVVHEPGRVSYEPIVEQYDLHATLLAQPPTWLEPDEDEEEDDLSPFQQQLIQDFPHRGELCALAGELWPSGGGLASARIGGYVDDEVMRSIAEQTLAGRLDVPVAQWYSHVEKEQHRLADEWVSLARFSVADEFYSGSFVIRHDDLSAGRLDRAFSVTEFSE
ncbi:YwqG family protein [Actinoplanes sp. TRM 88003]|uniref:YwqG family protein n=1 Tax=Paractinoplanes aksuensis TaxID=2939490 RepID=A0ABT1E192_9ACTN|nr:DUF1963 domain-containing protein [Actinoplanes aksuensis]MCO8276802.1 YwqG family protein [Actinoplanes aksuensis]